MNTHGMYHRPEWVMCGIPTDEGVMIVASKDLHSADISVDNKLEEIRMMGEMATHYVHTETTYTLTTRMGSITVAYGADYAEAIRILFKSWTPDRPRGKEIGSQAAIPMGMPELEDGNGG